MVEMPLLHLPPDVSFCALLCSAGSCDWLLMGSLAVLFLRELALPCSEPQLEALVSRLASPHAFGSVSGWTSDVFTEIGTLAGMANLT